jgi:dienelactone hydrolase
MLVPRRWRPVLTLLATGAFLAAGTLAWLLRDPEPYFADRHGTLAEVVRRDATLTNGALEETVHLRSTSGLEVSLAIRYTPDEKDPATTPAADHRRPLFLILGGHARGMAAGALVGETRGAIIAALEYPFDGDHRAKGLAVVRQVPKIRRAIWDTPPAVRLALDHLLERPDVDPARVELVGASFGAVFATVAAALDDRVTRLWLAHGGGKPFDLIDHGLKDEIPFAPLRYPVSALAHVIASGPRFAPERWVARVAPRPIVMLNALDDERIPRHTVDALWKSAKDPKRMVWLSGPHVQGNRPDVLAALVDTMFALSTEPGPAR